MNKPFLFAVMLCLLAGATSAQRPDVGRDIVFVNPSAPSSHHISSASATAKTDTIYLMGGPDRGDGKFQDDNNSEIPDWEGWTSIDLTAGVVSHWNIDSFNSPTGSNAMWCGEIFVSCGGSDTPEGYGNNYREWLDWRGVVADNGVATDMTVTYDLNYDIEPGYDYLDLEYESTMGWTQVVTYDGLLAEPVHATVAFTVAASDLVGPGSNEVHLRFEATSDGAWSDSDCLWPTSGHSQIDNISVSGTNGLASTFDDFESGESLANWQTELPLGVGDFAQIMGGLADLDPCIENRTPQVVFIDDGLVVPCTGGTLGTTWTYGPGSFIHNLTGGCLGPSEHINNEVWSPPIAWADEFGNPLNTTHLGARFDFGVYKHLPIMNGMFYVWHVRSSSDDGITWSSWGDRSFVFYGPAQYGRHNEIVTDLLVPSPTHIQVAFGIYEIGWMWGFHSTDGTPAPYFDNVAVKAFELGGPIISTREIEMAQDNFPTIGDLDYVNLGNNSIRFDMAGDILGSISDNVLPGDTLVFTVVTNRPGAALVSSPRLHYTMKTNPLFDPYRTHPTSGSVIGDTTRTTGGSVVPDRWNFDLPDDGLFFPGDIIHYYIEAVDNMGGEVRTTTLPAELSGYGTFTGDAGFTTLQWSSAFTVHGLPTMFSDSVGDQPPMLLWNDFGNRGGENEWSFALQNLGYTQGVDYDVYYTNAPTSGVSNGLGSRASLPQIAGYELMLYTLGNLSNFGITSFTAGNWATDKSNDDDLLDAWLLTGRDLLATGSGLVGDLSANGGIDGANFVATWFSVSYQGSDIGPEIGGIVSPMVSPVPGNSVSLSTSFRADNSITCLDRFEVVTPIGTAERIATWENGETTPYAAGVFNQVGDSRVVYFPVDFMAWQTPQGYVSPSGLPFAARTDALDEILRFFGHLAPGNGTGVDDLPQMLSSRIYPNPFNPRTTVEYAVPHAGRVSIKLYDLRGQLVRTLVDEHVDAGLYSRVWDGQDDRGESVASGVYFAETRAGGQSRVEKLALVR